VADEKTKMIEKDMEEEVSHWPPVSIYLNLFNDINIDILIKLFKSFVQPLSRPKDSINFPLFSPLLTYINV
jgi:hypothetical protein